MSNNLRSDASDILAFLFSDRSRLAARNLILSVCFVWILVAPRSVLAQPGSTPGGRMKQEGKALFSPSSGGATTTDADGNALKNSDAWVIVLGAFSGDDQDQLAQEALAKITSQTPLSGARLIKKEKGTVIEYGRFKDPADPEAKAELQRIRETRIGDSTPMDRAFFAPPQGITGALPQYDLRNWKQDALAGKALYTLQIAAYGRDDNKPPTAKESAQFREAAEKAAAQLRREGDQAFYYHGPTLSLVTIGLFGESDLKLPIKGEHGVEPGFQSPRITDLQKRYPNNLLNGKGIRETVKTTDGKVASKLQASRLVALPKEGS